MADSFTQLLAAWRGGDLGAREQLMHAAYAELRAVARRQLSGERSNHTLQPTALVNEAWLRLAGPSAPPGVDRTHFVGIVARLMRQILVDHARRHHAAKRDGGERVTLSLLAVLSAPQDPPDVDLEHLDAALSRLERIDSARARVVELRYFGGLTVEETAAEMGLSPATIKRHWQSARVWLFDALS